MSIAKYLINSLLQSAARSRALLSGVRLARGVLWGPSNSCRVTARGRLTSRLLAILVCALLGVACPGVDVTIRSYWPNGQLQFVEGGHDANNVRTGVWVYFSEDGSILYEQSYSDGATYERTGVYESGKRVRLPTEQEIANARLAAERIMKERAAVRAASEQQSK